MEKMEKKRPRGRPALQLSEATKSRICREVASGKSLRSVLKVKGMPSRTRIMEELEKDATFASQYARARRQNIEFHIDSIIDLADSATAKNAHAVRLKVDVRKWLASKLVPKIYGDRLELAGGVESPIRDALTDIGRARRVAYSLALGAMAMQKVQAGTRPALPAPAPDPVFRDHTPSDGVRGAHPGASEATMKDINEPPERERPKPGDGPVWYRGSDHEQGLDE